MADIVEVENFAGELKVIFSDGVPTTHLGLMAFPSLVFFGLKDQSRRFLPLKGFLAPPPW